RSPLSEGGRQWIAERLPESKETLYVALNLFKNLLDRFQTEVAEFGNFPSLFMGLVAPNGDWEHYGGHLRFTDSDGNIVADNLSEDNYADFIGESVEKWSYLKFPYYKPLGYPAGIYRVGPLARLNVCRQIGTPEADRELQEYRDRAGGVATSSFFYHYARLVEILAALEGIEQLINDPDIVSKNCRARAEINCTEAVGVSEAPRGTLFHHYKVDNDGLIQKVNLIIATGNNNLAMNKTVAQIAKHYIHNNDVQEGFLNRVEAGIRCYDPCLSCSTHAAGQMPLMIDLVDPQGQVIHSIQRD
ncbi:MAG: Ni/Fe hydrogenase subunit alpha, partial [Synechocystis sp.]|nr:Ni/Fe hydrogenase subunit alpha [Synechocystis sp.]